MKNKIIKIAFFNAFATALYIAAISSFLFYTPKIFDQAKPDTIFAPILMLSLLVFSASLTGLLVFGRPIHWYLNGQKSEAISLLIYTLGIFFVFTAIAFSVIFFTL